MKIPFFKNTWKMFLKKTCRLFLFLCNGLQHMWVILCWSPLVNKSTVTLEVHVCFCAQTDGSYNHQVAVTPEQSEGWFVLVLAVGVDLLQRKTSSQYWPRWIQTAGCPGWRSERSGWAVCSCVFRWTGGWWCCWLCAQLPPSSPAARPTPRLLCPSTSAGLWGKERRAAKTETDYLQFVFRTESRESR